jgi:hypothetical protein
MVVWYQHVVGWFSLARRGVTTERDDIALMFHVVSYIIPYYKIMKQTGGCKMSTSIPMQGFDWYKKG